MDPILEIARKHKLRVLEDCAQCLGGRYKGKYVGSIGDIGINSFQLSKSITSGEGRCRDQQRSGALRAGRALPRRRRASVRPTAKRLGGGLLAAFASCNFRMNEFTGAVLKGQLQKLETICEGLRKNARKVREGDRRPAGTQAAEDARPGGRFGRGRVPGSRHPGTARQVPAGDACRRRPGHRGPAVPRFCRSTSGSRTRSPSIPLWPSFQSPEGKAIRYGRECCPRTIDILGRAGGVIMDPNFTDEDVQDIVRAIRKVYLAIGPA